VREGRRTLGGWQSGGLNQLVADAEDVNAVHRVRRVMHLSHVRLALALGEQPLALDQEMLERAEQRRAAAGGARRGRTPSMTNGTTPTYATPSCRSSSKLLGTKRRSAGAGTAQCRNNSRRQFW
jgi:hypothetical protein